MRTLKFIVDEQIIKKDPNCDFSNIIPGTEGYLQAEFSFSPEWNDCVKVVAFYTTLGRECSPQVLEDGKTCMIPAEALTRKAFLIRVLGKHKNLKLTTNRVIVTQDGGNT